MRKITSPSNRTILYSIIPRKTAFRIQFRLNIYVYKTDQFFICNLKTGAEGHCSEFAKAL